MFGHAQPYLRILRRTPADGWYVALIALVVAGGAFLETVGLGAAMPFIQLVQGEHVALFEPIAALVAPDPDGNRTVIAAGVILVIVFAFKNLYLAGATAFQMRFVYRKMVEVERSLLAGYLARPWEFHLSVNSAEIIRNVISETGLIFAAPMASLFIVASELFTIAVLGCLLVVLEPLAVPAAGIVVGALALLVQRTFLRRIAAIGAATRDHQAEMLVWANQALGGMKEIRVLRREAFFVERFAAAVAQHAGALRDYRTTAFVPRYTLETLGVVGLVVVCAVASARDGLGPHLIPLLGVLALAVLRILPSLARIAAALTDLRFYAAAARTLVDELDREKQATGPGREVLAPKEEVSLVDAVVRYAGAEKPALDGATLRVRVNETVALVGPSGAGKTTAADALIGLLQLEKGHLEVDGRRLEEHEIERYSRSIGYIPQSIFLIDDTLRANIAFGVDPSEIDQGRLARAITSSQLDSVIASLPEGLDTKVGERGVRLSGGQRQRIGIARALYLEPRVLVLDEATSALDGVTEREVVQAIESLRHERAIVVIAHRLSTVRNCDRLVYMSGGRIVDQGSWDELSARCEPFCNMLRATKESSSMEAPEHAPGGQATAQE